MLLEIVALGRDVDGHFLAVGQPHTVIFRKAELGFLGVIVLTWRQTPRFCGH